MVRIHYAARAVLLHASSGWMVADSPDTVFRLVLPLQTVFARGSFTPEALPSFIATTSPCADPGASHLLFVLRTYRRRPCRLHHQRLVIGTVPLWSVFLSWSAAPYIPAVRRVHLTSSSPSTSAFASLRACWLKKAAIATLPVSVPKNREIASQSPRERTGSPTGSTPPT